MGMSGSQTYLRCREPKINSLIEDVTDLLKERLWDDFVNPGREAIDSAISDGEELEQQVRDLEGQIEDLETERDALKEEVERLKAELEECQSLLNPQLQLTGT